MRILTRYLLRAHAGPFLFALSILTALLFINAVYRRFEDLAGKGLPAGVITEVLALSLPHIIALTLPMAVLVAVLFAFSQLAADNEITALKGSGINLLRLMIPLVLAAVVLATFMVWFNDRILPETNHALKNRLTDINRKSPTLTLEEQVINQIRTTDLATRYYLQSARVDPATNRLFDVVIYDLSAGNQLRSVYADSGRMAFNQARTDLFLVLYDGFVHETEIQDPSAFQRTFFKQDMIMLAGVGTELQRVQESFRSDREMSLAMLQAQVDTARMELAEVHAEARALSERIVTRALEGPAAPPILSDTGVPLPVREAGLGLLPGGRRLQQRVMTDDELVMDALRRLEVLRNREQTLEERANRNIIEYQKKYAIPVACIIFVLIGAPIAVRFPRGGVGMVIAISLFVFGVYYMSLIGGESLGDRGIISPLVGPWAPNVVFFVLSLWGLARIGTETATTRGGGWDDLWFTVRRFVTRPFRRRRALQARKA